MQISPIVVASIIAILGGLLTFLSTLVFFVVWLIRLEGRVNRNQERWSEEKESRLALGTHLDRHIENADIHFNKQFFYEFKSKIERQLTDLQQGMSAGFVEIKTQMSELWDSQTEKK